jgi:activator of HSP90 ATPase
MREQQANHGRGVNSKAMTKDQEKPIRSMSSMTRRNLFTGALTAVGVLVAGPQVWGKSKSEGGQEKIKEPQSTGIEGLLTYLHQEIEIKASRPRIYEALLDSKQFTGFTGMPAEIDRAAGGAFSIFGGLVTGRNVELVANQRIVQAWRPADWDAGVYTLVKFELKDWASQTKLILDHTGFPEGNFRHLDSGWYLRYWEPLRKFLA